MPGYTEFRQLSGSGITGRRYDTSVWPERNAAVMTVVEADAAKRVVKEKAYEGIADHDTRHESVNHSAGEYVRADVHTNTVESVWSLFKRSIVGAYHQISKKHMDKYLDEQAWRFDNRRNPYLFRDTLLKLLEAKAVPFTMLVN